MVYLIGDNITITWNGWIFALAGRILCVIMQRSNRDEDSSQATLQADSVIGSKSMPQKRPFGVTLFLWLVLSLSAWGLLRLFAAWRWWDVLTEFHARLSPLYLSI